MCKNFIPSIIRVKCRQRLLAQYKNSQSIFVVLIIFLR